MYNTAGNKKEKNSGKILVTITGGNNNQETPSHQAASSKPDTTQNGRL